MAGADALAVNVAGDRHAPTAAGEGADVAGPVRHSDGISGMVLCAVIIVTRPFYRERC